MDTLEPFIALVLKHLLELHLLIAIISRFRKISIWKLVIEFKS